MMVTPATGSYDTNVPQLAQYPARAESGREIRVYEEGFFAGNLTLLGSARRPFLWATLILAIRIYSIQQL